MLCYGQLHRHRWKFANIFLINIIERQFAPHYCISSIDFLPICFNIDDFFSYPSTGFQHLLRLQFQTHPIWFHFPFCSSLFATVYCEHRCAEFPNLCRVPPHPIKTRLFATPALQSPHSSVDESRNTKQRMFTSRDDKALSVLYRP